MKAVAVALPGAFLLAMLLLSAGRDPGRDVDGDAVVLWGGLESLPRDGTLVVAGPVRAYSPADVDAASAFVRGGGRIAFLDVTPEAASLVHALDIGVEAGPALVFDPDVDDEGRFVVTTTGTLGDVHALRVASSLVVFGGSAVATTGPFAWADADADGTPDVREARGSWSVAALATAGTGEVLVLGTPELADDPAVQAWLDAHGPLLIDHGQGAATDPLAARRALAGHEPSVFAVPVAVLLLGAIVAGFRLSAQRLIPRRRRRVVDPQTLELVAELGP